MVWSLLSVVQIEGKNVVWLVHANQLVRASPEQLRSASLREWHAARNSEEAMFPVKTWIQRIQDHSFFDLESEELPPEDQSETEPDPVNSDQPPGSQYAPSLAELSEDEGIIETEEPVPGDFGGLRVPVGDDGGEDLLFGDTLDFWEADHTKFWEIDVTPATIEPLQEIEDPEEIVNMAIDGHKKRVEVSPKELGEEDQLRFAAAKGKEVKAWLHHRTVQKVAKGRIPDHAVMRCRWLLTWKGANGDEPPGEIALNGKKAKARLVVKGQSDVVEGWSSNGFTADEQSSFPINFI